MSRLGAIGLTVAAMLGLSGCMSLIGSMAADTLSSSILNQRDPSLVEGGVPA